MHVNHSNRMPEKIVEIKEFSPEIHRFVCRMINELTPNREGPSEEAFRAILGSENAHLFVLYAADGTPAGTLTVGIYRTPTGCKAWIEDVVVDSAHQGLGYGKKIVEYAIGFIRATNADTISLTTNASRITANQLYQRLGFERYETNVYKMRLSTIF